MHYYGRVKKYIEDNGYSGYFELVCDNDGVVSISVWNVDGLQEPVLSELDILYPCCPEDRQLKYDEIQSAYNDIISSGFEYELNTFDMDDGTLSIIGARLAYSNGSSTLSNDELTFYDSDKNAVLFADKADIVAFFEALIIRRNSLDQQRIELKKLAKDATTDSELDSIVISFT